MRTIKTDTNLVKYLKTLVEMPTVSSNFHANNKAITYISEFLSEYGFFVKEFEFDKHSAIFATTQRTKIPKVILYGHVDVVDAPASMFELTEDDTRLYGRGTIDMKYAIASYLDIVTSHQTSLGKLNLGIMIVTDEEIGGGSANKILQLGYGGTVAVVPDGGKDWIFEDACKGAWTVKANSSGVGVHGSRPWEGDSASFRLLDFLTETKDLFADQGTETHTLNISQITTTSKSDGTIKENPQNRVPHQASATLDIRYTSKKDLEGIEKSITRIAENHRINLEIIATYPSTNHELTNPLVNGFVKRIIPNTNNKLKTMLSSGANDSSYFEAAGIPCAVVCPPGWGKHADDEWIDKEGFKIFTEALDRFIVEFATIE